MGQIARFAKPSEFDSHGFTFWKPGPAEAPVDHIASENDGRGNTWLVISGNNGASGGSGCRGRTEESPTESGNLPRRCEIVSFGSLVVSY